MDKQSAKRRWKGGGMKMTHWNNGELGSSCSSPCIRKQTTKRYTIAETRVSQRLAIEDGFVTWAVWALYDRQTSFEQNKHVTRTKNGVGFNAPDAPILSPIAEDAARGEDLTLDQ